jgi:NAD-dependent SIR2 family protein deacetylase
MMKGGFHPVHREYSFMESLKQGSERLNETRGDSMADYKEVLALAANAIANAEALMISAGAGMGVDSGLPDFRGNEGFWNAYPPYRHLNVSFVEMANPVWFDREPSFAWGFYGHRRNLYRATDPHEGFKILLRWGESKTGKYFVFTSNVDNQFQKAGFDPEKIIECHGALEWNQCNERCGAAIFRAGPEEVAINMDTMRADGGSLPLCPHCGSLARPNILMFGDFGWDSSRESDQNWRFQRWLDEQDGRKVTVIECGAGEAVPTVRSFSEMVATGSPGNTLIRINPHAPRVPHGHIGLPMGSLEAMKAIDSLLGEWSS